MKQRLLDYRDLERYIDNCLERLERLEEKKSSVAAARLDGMPKAQGVYDRVGDLVSKYLQLETELKEKIRRRDDERRSIAGIMDAAGLTADERSVIEIRYFDGEEWGEVLWLLYGGRDEYNELYDNYKQRIFRYHRSAIDKMNR